MQEQTSLSQLLGKIQFLVGSQEAVSFWSTLLYERNWLISSAVFGWISLEFSGSSVPREVLKTLSQEVSPRWCWTHPEITSCDSLLVRAWALGTAGVLVAATLALARAAGRARSEHRETVTACVPRVAGRADGTRASCLHVLRAMPVRMCAWRGHSMQVLTGLES